MISVIDYGAGNLRSVTNTLDRVGAAHELVRNPEALQRATKIILPGVGHFGQMMRALDHLNLRDALKSRIEGAVPFLGICLGLQALFGSSEEAPDERGLALFPARIRKFSGDLRIPHMGWNQLHRCGQSRLLESTGEAPFVYFANSFYAPLADATAAACDYGGEFSAIIEHKNIFAVQFHPEKSAATGIQVIRNFACL